MNSPSPNLPKYKLSKRQESHKNTTPPNPQTTAPSEVETPPKQALTLGQAQAQPHKPDSMSSSSDMLKDAYGEGTRKRKRQEFMARLDSIAVLVVGICLYLVATFAYAHIYKGWPILEPKNWYAPFALSAALCAWICIKSIKFWEDRERWLALTGIVIAGALSYWNLYILKYAAAGPHIIPSNGLWAPSDINDLLITTEINARRGISQNKTKYTELPTQTYYRAFNSISHAEWKPMFERFLSPAELKKVNSINIHDNMYLVVERMQTKRANTWEQLEEQRNHPEFKFQIQQSLLAPYIWAFSHL
jgi:hypothetical protein